MSAKVNNETKKKGKKSEVKYRTIHSQSITTWEIGVGERNVQRQTLVQRTEAMNYEARTHYCQLVTVTEAKYDEGSEKDCSAKMIGNHN